MNEIVTTEAELDEIYGPPLAVSISKELDHISAHYRAYIEKSPFVVIASSGPGGLDCTPRGDPAGFARVVDEHTVLIPDRRGNNRIDTLRNLVHDPRISLLFLIPGIGLTLRLNGQAAISTNLEMRQSFAMQSKLPATVITVTAERVYTQCPKALVRSKLWDASAHISRGELPSSGEMLQAIEDSFDGAGWDAQYGEMLQKTIY